MPFLTSVGWLMSKLYDGLLKVPVTNLLRMNVDSMKKLILNKALPRGEKIKTTPSSLLELGII